MNFFDDFLDRLPTPDQDTSNVLWGVVAGALAALAGAVVGANLGDDDPGGTGDA